MAKMNYKKPSPYYSTGQTSWYLDLLNYRSLPTDRSDELVIIQSKYHERPDLLSYDLYGTSDYWWTFMILNPNVIKDPIYDFKSGTAIYTALPDRLIQALGS